MGRGAASVTDVQAFVYQSFSTRVVFGVGALAKLSEEVDRLGARRALVLSTPQQRADAEKIAGMLGPRSAGVYAEAVMHVPIEIARAALAEARRVGADCAVTIGGGSTTRLGKAMARGSSIAILAIPTTYAGSEMDTIY